MIDSRRLLGCAAVLALAGCLVSEEPLFNSGNAAATPLAAGAYEGCEIEDGKEPSDCKSFEITVNETGLYKITADEEPEDAVLVRFKRIGRGLFALQSWSGDDQPQYLAAASVPNGVSISLIECEDLPASFKKKYEARGELVIEGRSDCLAKTAGAVVAASKAWVKTGAFKNGDRVVYTKKSAG